MIVLAMNMGISPAIRASLSPVNLTNCVVAAKGVVGEREEPSFEHRSPNRHVSKFHRRQRVGVIIEDGEAGDLAWRYAADLVFLPPRIGGLDGHRAVTHRLMSRQSRRDWGFYSLQLKGQKTGGKDARLESAEAVEARD